MATAMLEATVTLTIRERNMLWDAIDRYLPLALEGVSSWFYGPEQTPEQRQQSAEEVAGLVALINDLGWEPQAEEGDFRLSAPPGQLDQILSIVDANIRDHISDESEALARVSDNLKGHEWEKDDEQAGPMDNDMEQRFVIQSIRERAGLS
jgi:hypothetical protein